MSELATGSQSPATREHEAEWLVVRFVVEEEKGFAAAAAPTRRVAGPQSRTKDGPKTCREKALQLDNPWIGAWLAPPYFQLYSRTRTRASTGRSSHGRWQYAAALFHPLGDQPMR